MGGVGGQGGNVPVSHSNIGKYNTESHYGRMNPHLQKNIRNVAELLSVRPISSVSMHFFDIARNVLRSANTSTISINERK